MSQAITEIFVDGACRGNPGIGAWAALLRYQSHEKELFGVEEQTTNNRMELMAAIQALMALKKSCKIIMTTDSQYVQKGMMEWLPNWKKNGWKKKGSEAIKNLDLWQQLDTLAQQHDIEWHWVKGHSGHPENERVDRLANLAIDAWQGK